MEQGKVPMPTKWAGKDERMSPEEIAYWLDDPPSKKMIDGMREDGWTDEGIAEFLRDFG